MMLNKLREETADLHKQLEADNLANKVMDHSISLEEYKILLFQNLIAYQVAEIEIAKFLPGYGTEKTERLRKDLIGLGVTDLNSDLSFSCETEAEAVGAAYVIEGSAMGGMLIGKEIKNCDSLNNIKVQLFFNGERSNIKTWNEYLKFLRSREFTDEEIEMAAKKAKETFLLFKKAFSLEPSNC